jgi:bifunctional non-homologous end joining protein LigD
VKVRFAKRQEFVIGGYKPADATFESILVGYYDQTKLRFAGKVRAGFTPHLRAEVHKHLTPLGTNRCPFVNLPNAGRRSHWGEGVTEEEMGQLRWVRPKVVVEVSFTEWTRENNLRHAAFVALRQDKRAGEVHRETSLQQS